MVSTCRYTPTLRTEWDTFVGQAANATLLHLRSYMDYHADRFEDASLVFRNERQQLIALLPACMSRTEQGVIVSHQGLTYGGFIVGHSLHTFQLEEVIDAALQYYHTQLSAHSLIISPAPQIYSSIPTDEQLYLIGRRGATLIARHLSQAVRTDHHPPMSQLRRRCVNKARRLGISAAYTDERADWEEFHQILSEVLSCRHAVVPVHTAKELWQLHLDNPDHIRLLAAREAGTIVAGTIIYLSPTVAHTQYLASSPRGQQTGALDLCIDYLLHTVTQPYLDFGVSTERDGSLNYGLTLQKEGFGGRGICYDTYEVKIHNS